MTEQTTPAPESQIIEPAAHQPAPEAQVSEPAPDTKPEAAEPKAEKLSRREQIEASLAKVEAEAKGADSQSKGKAEETPDGKGKTDDSQIDAAKAKPDAAKADEAVKQPQQAAEGEPSSEDDKSSPPARIAEDAKKFWRSTPRAMKAEFARMDGEIQRVTQEAGEAVKFHSELREFDQLARSHGTTVKQAIQNYRAAEQALAQDFGAGVKGLAENMGRTPQEVITSTLKAYGITPQQFAQAVSQNPNAFAPQPTLAKDPAIQQLMQSQQQMTQWMQQQEEQRRQESLAAHQRDLAKTIESWMADKPDFASLEGYIAEIIKSGIIESRYGKGLTETQRLDVAYRMAGGSASQVQQAAAQPAPSPVAPSGPPQVEASPSISGAPGNGRDPKSTSAKPKSRRASIEAAMAKLA